MLDDQAWKSWISVIDKNSLFDRESIGKLLLRVKVKATTGYGLAALPELGQGADARVGQGAQPG